MLYSLAYCLNLPSENFTVYTSSGFRTWIARADAWFYLARVDLLFFWPQPLFMLQYFFCVSSLWLGLFDVFWMPCFPVGIVTPLFSSWNLCFLTLLSRNKDAYETCCAVRCKNTGKNCEYTFYIWMKIFVNRKSELANV